MKAGFFKIINKLLYSFFMGLNESRTQHKILSQNYSLNDKLNEILSQLEKRIVNFTSRKIRNV